jgi:hypothetical protein
MNAIPTKVLHRGAALLLLAGVILAIYLLAIAPYLAAYHAADSGVEESEALLQRYSEIARSRQSLQMQLDQLVARQAASGIYLSGNTDALAAAALQDIVNKAIGSSGGTLRSVQILPAKADGDFKWVGVRVQMTSSIVQLARSLYALEAGKTVLFVDNLDVSNRRARRRRGADQDENPTLLIRLDLYGYLRPEVG